MQKKKITQKIRNMKNYKVNDSETGNYVIYEGKNIFEAYDAIIDSHNKDEVSGEERTNLDLYADDERIYCGTIDSDSILASVVAKEAPEEINRIIGALANFGGDPFLVETYEEAIDTIIDIKNSTIQRTIKPEDEEFEQLAKMLDLDKEKNKVKEIHSYVYGIEFVICYPDDWSYAE